jgi:toxin ParE1/3/4
VNIRWNARARHDLDRIQAYIEQFDLQAAKRVAQEIKSSTLKLKRFPHLGRVAEDIDVRLLQVSGRPYVLPYRIDKHGIEILAVFDQRRDPEDMV